MQLSHIEKKKDRYPLKVSFYILFAGWTIIILGIFAWSYKTTNEETVTLAKREARNGYEKDIMFRSWATMHGGVYVPITKETPPNPFLSNIPDRDITTPSNKKLTLMNPAYINRQIHELSYKQSGIIGHITSLKPIRKENAPDKWEIIALNEFEKGAKEFSGFDLINNEKYFRYMGALVTTTGCLKCHETQGYKLGDIRGGISSSIPWKNYQQAIIIQATNLLFGYGVLWAIGFISLLMVKKRFFIYITKRDTDEEEMQKLNEKLQLSKNIIEENLIQENLLVKELTKTKEKLEKINSEKDKLFSIIAHDLKSPFQGFLGLTESMAEDIGSFSQDELSEVSQMMYDTSKNIYALLNNLLEWARMQQGAISFEPVEIDLSETVSRNIDLISTRGKQKGIEIINEAGQNRTVKADEAMLNSILRNLLSNAVKFTRNGGQIKVSSKETENNMVEISVTDSGIGMTEDLSERLFMADEKVGRQGTDDESSTGLGLLLCKEFVERHEGKIWVKSLKNSGSVFYFTLPGTKNSE
ncbi:MAG: ATP-binding protein [Ignavibacteria bacterium]